MICKYFGTYRCLCQRVWYTRIESGPIQLRCHSGPARAHHVWKAYMDNFTCHQQRSSSRFHEFCQLLLYSRIQSTMTPSYWPWLQMPRCHHSAMALRIMDNSYTRQLVTKTNRTQDNSYSRQLLPKTTGTQDNSYPGHLVPKTTRTQTQGNSCSKRLEPKTTRTQDRSYPKQLVFCRLVKNLKKGSKVHIRFWHFFL